jgi:hypothetical protein
LVSSKWNGSVQDFLLELQEAFDDGGVAIDDGDSTLWLEIVENYTQYFPVNGATVSVDMDPRKDWTEYVERGRLLFAEAMNAAQAPWEEPVFIVWDCAECPNMIILPSLVLKYLDSIVSRPCHTFILPGDATWCVGYRMEGFMGYGFATEKKSP